MKIIISPAKKMNMSRDSYEVTGMPCFLADTKILMQEIKKLSLAEAKALLDYFVSHKKDKEYRRLMKDGKRARKNALKAARSLICK